MSGDLPVVLTIAGSDSGGGAGVQMDLKVFAALGVFGTCAVTALTAQNTVGVRGAWEAPPDFVAAQIEAVLDDLPVKAAKTGMLSSEAVARAVVQVIGRREFPPLVVDPVVVAKDGTHLLSDAGIEVVRDRLLPLATIATPNIPEAEALAGMAIKTREDAARAAEKLRGLGCSWVLVKGGHLQGREVTDLLLGPDHEHELSSPRLPGGPFHGTGCAFSAAIAAFLARGRRLPEAVHDAREFLQHLLRDARTLGGGARVLHPQSYSPSKGNQQ
ncbi:MAG: bifunctional hydroxymethylpyrimidine kinase/phosphomethylpyrimidine kinase [Armatimonadota bacterium]|nr:MAG: bifunctional hydroxymethylpyrimidine kinase/phosphomethylpyrimidine kinase [Armatimonadota bacterium]